MQYIIAGLAAFIITLILTPLVRLISTKYGIIDQPGGRRINKEPIPRMGGVAIVISFWLTVLGISLFAPGMLDFSHQSILGVDRNLLGVFVGAMILMTVGIVDDIQGLSPLVKIASHVAAASCIPLFGIHIQWLAHPFGGPDLQLPLWLDNLLIVGWIVGMINVVNWLDGLDGLASGVSSIASIIIFFLSLASFVNQPSTATLAIVIFGATLGFLRYNYNPARIFMGDSGSMFLGFMLAILAVISGGKLATAGLVLGLPILDAAWVILRRIMAGQRPWQADRRHLHHRLLDAGLSQRQTVLLYWAFAGLFGGIALASRTYGKTMAGVAILIIMLIIGFTLVVLDRRKRPN